MNVNDSSTTMQMGLLPLTRSLKRVNFCSVYFNIMGEAQKGRGRGRGRAKYTDWTQKDSGEGQGKKGMENWWKGKSENEDQIKENDD